jgi:hypothetical protein
VEVQGRDGKETSKEQGKKKNAEGSVLRRLFTYGESRMFLWREPPNPH